MAEYQIKGFKPDDAIADCFWPWEHPDGTLHLLFEIPSAAKAAVAFDGRYLKATVTFPDG